MKWRILKTIARDSQAILAAWQEYHKILREYNVLRLEVVYSAQSYIEIKGLMDKVGSMKPVWSYLEGCILKFTGRTEYINSCMTQPLQILQRAICDSISSGIESFSKERVKEVHRAEKILRYFLTPKLWYRFYYGHIKDLIRSGKIHLLR